MLNKLQKESIIKDFRKVIENKKSGDEGVYINPSITKYIEFTNSGRLYFKGDNLEIPFSIKDGEYKITGYITDIYKGFFFENDPEIKNYNPKLDFVIDNKDILNQMGYDFDDIIIEIDEYLTEVFSEIEYDNLGD